MSDFEDLSNAEFVERTLPLVIGPNKTVIGKAHITKDGTITTTFKDQQVAALFSANETVGFSMFTQEGIPYEPEKEKVLYRQAEPDGLIFTCTNCGRLVRKSMLGTHALVLHNAEDYNE